MSSSKKNVQETEFIALSSQNKKYIIKNPFSEEPRINGKRTEIKILDDEDGFTYILYNNKKYLAEITEKTQNKYNVLINGVSYIFTVETPISYKRKKYIEKTKAKSKTEILEAPMPGKIVDILTEVGSHVKEGEALLILEAMKMQNEITSPVSGKVVHISVHKEDIVNKYDLLVEIEKG
jgi:glutaconyl-CoA/methylmalonyl-CoA decarboxylase subunit gamma